MVVGLNDVLLCSRPASRAWAKTTVATCESATQVVAGLTALCSCVISGTTWRARICLCARRRATAARAARGSWPSWASPRPFPVRPTATCRRAAPASAAPPRPRPPRYEAGCCLNDVRFGFHAFSSGFRVRRPSWTARAMPAGGAPRAGPASCAAGTATAAAPLATSSRVPCPSITRS